MTSELVPYVAPLAAFLVVAMLGLGYYRTANHGGLLVRKRLGPYTPAPTPADKPSLDDSPILKQRRFSSISSLDKLLKRNDIGERISLELARAALPIRVGEYLLIRWLTALGLFVIVSAAARVPVIGLLAGLVGYVVPSFFVRWRQMKRVREFDDQLVDALTLLANTLKSGYSFLQGMEALAREVPAPMGEEFEQALRTIRMGGVVEDALVEIGRRVRSLDFELVATAMVIQRQVGGNLAEILTNIAYTVRERHRILREIRVLTAQERLSGNVVAGLPIFLIITLSVLSPNYIQGMVDTPSGKIMLGAGLVMELLGLLVIRKIMDIDV